MRVAGKARKDGITGVVGTSCAPPQNISREAIEQAIEDEPTNFESRKASMTIQQSKIYQSLKSCAETLGFRTRRGEPKGWARFAPADSDVDQFRARAANDMERIHYEHTDRVSHKWHDYLAAYDRHARRFRGKDV